jgi:hypothetical protein
VKIGFGADSGDNCDRTGCLDADRRRTTCVGAHRHVSPRVEPNKGHWRAEIRAGPEIQKVDRDRARFRQQPARKHDVEWCGCRAQRLPALSSCVPRDRNEQTEVVGGVNAESQSSPFLIPGLLRPPAPSRLRVSEFPVAPLLHAATARIPDPVCNFLRARCRPSRSDPSCGKS